MVRYIEHTLINSNQNRLNTSTWFKHIRHFLTTDNASMKSGKEDHIDSFVNVQEH